MKTIDRPISVFFILLSVAICLATIKYEGGILTVPGFMIFPLLLGLSLVTLSIINFTQCRSSSRISFSALFSKGELLKITYLLGSFSLCILFFETIGFLVSTFVLMGLVLKGIGGKTVGRSSFYALIIALSSYMIFAYLLGVRLPKGFLGV